MLDKTEKQGFTNKDVERINNHLFKSPNLIVLANNYWKHLMPFVFGLIHTLSEKEKTVFISYQDTLRNILSNYEAIYGKISEKLIIETSINFYHENLPYELDQLIKSSNCKNLVIQDLNSLLGEQIDLDVVQRNNLIKELHHIATKNKIRMILLSPISSKAEERGAAMIPRIEDVTWARALTELADQVYAGYNFDAYDIVMDEAGNSTIGRFDLIPLIGDEDVTTFFLNES